MIIIKASMLVNHSAFTCAPSVSVVATPAGIFWLIQSLITAEFTQSSIKLGRVLNNWLNIVQNPTIKSKRIPRRISFKASKIPNKESLIAFPMESFGRSEEHTSELQSRENLV